MQASGPWAASGYQSSGALMAQAPAPATVGMCACTRRLLSVTVSTNRGHDELRYAPTKVPPATATTVCAWTKTGGIVTAWPTTVA